MSPLSPSVQIEFLLSASRSSLNDFELSRLNHAALLSKRLRETLHEMVEETALAMLARLLIENEGLRMTVNPLQESFDFVGSNRVEPFATFGAPNRINANAAAD
jgi:hypothetical protein